MRLFYTTTSPYARKVRVTAMEAGVDHRIALEQTTVRNPASPLLAISPVGRVPALALKDGTVLTESALICAYLQRLDGARTLMPEAAAPLGRALSLEGMACGFLEGLVTWARAKRAPDGLRNEAVIALETARTERCLDRFEVLVREAPFRNGVTLPQITLGCALGVLDFRHESYDWRTGRPRLAAWFERFGGRPSMAATVPHE